MIAWYIEKLKQAGSKRSAERPKFAWDLWIDMGITSKNNQVILEEYQLHKSILTESVKVKFAIKPAKTDSLSPTVVT